MPSWMDYVKDSQFSPNSNREMFRSGNVAPQETMTPQAPITASVPIREAGGSIVPAPDTSGLYAIYGRKNPYEAAAQQPGGTGINFAAPIAAYLSGKFEKEKADQVDAFMKKKEAYDAIKNQRDTRQANAKYLADTVFPAAQQEYLTVLKDTKDDKAASAAAAKVANQMAADQGIPAPEVVAFNAWKGATTFAVRNDKGEISTAIYKDGAMKVQDKKGNFNVPDEKWMSVKDLSDLMDAEAKVAKAGAKTMRDFDLAEITSQLKSFQNMKANAVNLSPEEQSQYNALLGEFNRRTDVKPGPTPEKAQEVSVPATRVDKVKSVFGFGPELKKTAEAPAPSAQPAAAPAPAAKAAPAAQSRTWMVNPSGKRVMIEGSIDDALKAGYKLVQ